jgi:hypothetical protein
MRRRAAGALTAVLVAAFSILLVEFVLRVFVVASPASAGRLMSLELPPMRIFRGTKAPEFLSPSTPYPGNVGDAVRLTRGDMWGHFRLDPESGYAPAENVTSQNRWWQSNNLGARSRTDTSRSVAPGRSRVLVFGESFAQGSRLPQEEAWPAILQQLDDRVEVVNFAVDGYSMGQALLRYRQLRRQVEYDLVILMFVPEADLIRDINTLRQLIDPAWDAPLMPRYRLQSGVLTLVPPLYRDPLDLHRRNAGRLTPELREHLRRHDRLYFPAKYEPVPVLGRSIWVRLMARARWRAQERAVHDDVMSPRGEAVQVSRMIFETMRREALADGAAFALVILPIEHRWWAGNTSNGDQERWSQMVGAVCGDEMVCVDLLPALRETQVHDVDRAFDQWHFGPKMNRRIAASVRRTVVDALVN